MSRRSPCSSEVIADRVAEGNAAFRRGDFEIAVRYYQAAHAVEPEMSHYQLNIAAAYLKLSK